METAVVFDLGETLVDESRYWSDWAERLGVSVLTLCAALGAAIERGEHHRSVLERFGAGRPGVDPPGFSSDDLYPDARPGLDALAAHGYRLAVAGNWPRPVAACVRTWDLPVEAVISAEEIGAEKPARSFFEGVAGELGVAPRDMTYVGDRIDNDVVAAAAAGVRSVWLRRGPWASIRGRDAPPGVVAIDDLRELEALLPELPRGT